MSCCAYVPVVKSYVLATNFYSHYCGLVFWVEIKDHQNRSWSFLWSIKNARQFNNTEQSGLKLNLIENVRKMFYHETDKVHSGSNQLNRETCIVSTKYYWTGVAYLHDVVWCVDQPKIVITIDAQTENWGLFRLGLSKKRRALIRHLLGAVNCSNKVPPKR